MKVKFLGALDGITGSCTWLKHLDSGKQWLVDCGMNQGPLAAFKNTLPFPFEPSEISDVFLTHSHIDHCGLIPKLYKDGFIGKIWCTEATAEIAKIQLRSALKHLDGELFEESHIDSIHWHTFDSDERFAWGKPIPVASNVSMTPMRSSHMLGACGISIAWKATDTKWRSMLFTGDVGNNTEAHTQFPMLKGNHVAFPSVEYIMIESTYGARVRDEQHRSMEYRLESLWKAIDQTINEKGGKVVIPCFAAQRAQDITLDIVLGLIQGKLKKRKGRPLKVLLHSPSIAKLNKVFAKQLEKVFWSRNGEKKQYLNDALQSLLKPQELSNWIKLLETELCDDKQLRSHSDFGEGRIVVSSDINVKSEKYDVILSSSGMAEGGFIVNHLDAYDHDSRNTIVITGYQAADTRGAGILARAEDPIEGFADVVNLSPYYSGHADQTILLDLVFDLGRFDQPRAGTTVFLNHGETTSKGSLKESIEERNREKNRQQRRIDDVIIPTTEDGWYDLDRGRFEPKDTRYLEYENQKLKRLLATYYARIDHFSKGAADET